MLIFYLAPSFIILFLYQLYLSKDNNYNLFLAISACIASSILGINVDMYMNDITLAHIYCAEKESSYIDYSYNEHVICEKNNGEKIYTEHDVLKSYFFEKAKANK